MDKEKQETKRTLKAVICLTGVYFLCGLFIVTLKAESCGWWGDASLDDDDESILVDSAEKPDDEAYQHALIIDPAAQTREGDRYRTGNGVDRDYTKALYWYRKAAILGFAGAQNNLAIMYEQGLGISKNMTEAARWFRKAAEQQDAMAQHALGRMYLKGEGVPLDFEKAAKWIRMSAEQGHHGAFSHMGEMYWQGLGVAQNNMQAYMWWRLAALHGDRESEKLLRIAAASMNSSSIAKADKMAREWMKKHE
jgi:TPR repeat protein